MAPVPSDNTVNIQNTSEKSSGPGAYWAIILGPLVLGLILLGVAGFVYLKRRMKKSSPGAQADFDAWITSITPENRSVYRNGCDSVAQLMRETHSEYGRQYGGWSRANTGPSTSVRTGEAAGYVGAEEEAVASQRPRGRSRTDSRRGSVHTERLSGNRFMTRSLSTSQIPSRARDVSQHGAHKRLRSLGNGPQSRGRSLTNVKAHPPTRRGTPHPRKRRAYSEGTPTDAPINNVRFGHAAYVTALGSSDSSSDADDCGVGRTKSMSRSQQVGCTKDDTRRRGGANEIMVHNTVTQSSEPIKAQPEEVIGHSNVPSVGSSNVHGHVRRNAPNDHRPTSAPLTNFSSILGSIKVGNASSKKAKAPGVVTPERVVLTETRADQSRHRENTPLPYIPTEIRTEATLYKDPEMPSFSSRMGKLNESGAGSHIPRRPVAGDMTRPEASSAVIPTNSSITDQPTRLADARRGSRRYGGLPPTPAEVLWEQRQSGVTALPDSPTGPPELPSPDADIESEIYGHYAPGRHTSRAPRQSW